MIIAFFGHSKFYESEENEKKLIGFLKDKVGDVAVDMYLGGYGEFDAFAYNCCKKLKESHPKISLIFITPYMTAGYQKNHLKFQREKYDNIIYPEIEDKPLKLALLYRNKWMIDKADFIIFGIDHSWGGAYKMYEYAKRKKKPIFNITGIDIE